MSVPLHRTRALPQARWLLAVVLLALVGALFFATRPRPKPPAPLPEADRHDLALRDGIWYAPGQTNGFTGILLDTYEDKALKSRSAISNGLLEGLSQGWWSNNVLQVTEYYSHGISHGVRTKYHPNGNKLSVANIVNGKIEGLYERWHENGTLAEQIHLTNGVPHGESLAFHSDGYLKARVRLDHGSVVEQQFWKPGEAR